MNNKDVKKPVKSLKKSFQLIERWQICQLIGKEFYHSDTSFEELLNILDQLKVDLKKK